MHGLGAGEAGETGNNGLSRAVFDRGCHSAAAAARPVKKWLFLATPLAPDVCPAKRNAKIASGSLSLCVKCVRSEREADVESEYLSDGMLRHRLRTPRRATRSVNVLEMRGAAFFLF